MASRLSVYGEALLHPVSVLALITWTVNDHYGKGVWPDLLSGKLSDVACLVVIPLLCGAGVELIFGWARQEISIANLWGYRSVVAGAVTAALIMAGINLWPSWANAYEVGLGAAQWAAFAPLRWLSSQDIGEPYRVSLTMDPSDLVTLPAALVGPWIHRQTQRGRDQRKT